MIGLRVVARHPMRGSRLLVLPLMVALAGCTSEPERSARTVRDDAPAEKADSKTPTHDPIARNYDAQGKLLPSDDYVVGIRLPRGSELSREDELHHVYRIQAPIDKVLAYIGPMMVTGNVERRGSEVNPTKVDVSILEVGSRLTRISVTEFPPPPKHVPSSDHTKAAAQESFRTLD